jgi:hypothetical protein
MVGEQRFKLCSEMREALGQRFSCIRLQLAVGEV